MRTGSFGSLRANTWRWAFLRHLRREAQRAAPAHAGAVMDRTRSSAQRLFDDSRRDVPDKPGLMMVGACSLVLAGYRELLAAGVDRLTAYEAVRRAFLATFATSTRWFVRTFLTLSRDPVAQLSKPVSLRLGQRAFGAMFGFEQRASGDEVDLVVTHCGFHQFYVEHGEPLLTLIHSEWDRIFMDAMNASRRPIQVQRPETISTGCDRCVFRFVRTVDVAGTALDIVLASRPELTASLSEQEG